MRPLPLTLDEQQRLQEETIQQKEKLQDGELDMPSHYGHGKMKLWDPKGMFGIPKQPPVNQKDKDDKAMRQAAKKAEEERRRKEREQAQRDIRNTSYGSR